MILLLALFGRGRPADRWGEVDLSDVFVAGALAVIRDAKIHATKCRPWLTALLAKRSAKVPAIAPANEITRIASDDG